jgi:hypothetical protein
MLMTSTGGDGQKLVTFNFNRYDVKDNAIDEHPVGILLSTGSVVYAAVGEHGDWQNRTEYLNARDVMDVLRAKTLQTSTGSLDSIANTSHYNAFLAMHQAIKAEGYGW